MAAAHHLEPGVIGPNSVIQLGLALEQELGRPEALRVFSAAGHEPLFDHPPMQMIDEAIPAALMATLWREVPSRQAHLISAKAGRLTADYVISNRIPGFAQWVIKLLPRWAGARVLLSAIEKNSWTFCGSGDCTTDTKTGLRLTLQNNPIRTPDCVWHVAVLQELFTRLIRGSVRVKYARGTSGHNHLDQFEIQI